MGFLRFTHIHKINKSKRTPYILYEKDCGITSHSLFLFFYRKLSFAHSYNLSIFTILITPLESSTAFSR